jgi:2-polyprenyl-3-methyl-5-hydroxy-6-metoxy-1,4-benzoquinol methylase
LLADWLMALPPAARVLDVGAGAALVERATLARGRDDLRWTALDGSLDCMQLLRRYAQAGAIVDLEQLLALPGGFDAVVAGDILEHLAAPERFVGLIHAALRPGGALLVSVPNVANIVVRAELLAGRFEYRERGILDRTHRVFFTRRRLREVLRRAGFAIEAESASPLPLYLVFPRLPRWILAGAMWALRGATAVLPRLLGYQLLARAVRS